MRNFSLLALPYDLDDAELERNIWKIWNFYFGESYNKYKKQVKAVVLALLIYLIEAEARDAMESLNEISLGKKP